MRNVIRADIRRIMCKISMWGLFVLSLAGIAAIVAFNLVYMKNSSFNYATGIVSGITDLASVIIGVAVFLAVYGDDFKCMTIITIIGRGQTRKKIILAKFINSIIISAILYTMIAVLVAIATAIYGGQLTADETLVMYLGVFKGFYLTIGYVTMAAISIYATGNIAFSVFWVVMFYLVLPTALGLTVLLPGLKNFHLSRYDYSGFATTGLSSIVLGMTAKGILMLVFDFIFYVGLSLVIIFAVFRKKELDF